MVTGHQPEGKPMFKVRYAVRSKDDDDTRMIAKSADVEVVPVIGTDFAFGGDRTSPDRG
jgi:hypothetical protein